MNSRKNSRYDTYIPTDILPRLDPRYVQESSCTLNLSYGIFRQEKEVKRQGFYSFGKWISSAISVERACLGHI